MTINFLLFDQFETLDAFGPVEILGKPEGWTLNYYSLCGGTMVSTQGAPIVTQSLQKADPEGVLVIPGGMGTRSLVKDEAFIAALKEAAAKSSYCLTICTGSALLARTGLITGKRATTNKRAFDWVVSVNPEVLWVKRARWVADGKYYTSSGVSAGMDMALGFIGDFLGEPKAWDIADKIEYTWHSNCNEDPFAG